MIVQYGWLVFIPVSIMLVLMTVAAIVLAYELLLSHMWEEKDDE